MEKRVKQVPLWFIRDNDKNIYDNIVKNIERRGRTVDDNLSMSFFNIHYGFDWRESIQGGAYWDKINIMYKKLYNESLVIDNYSII